MCLPWNHKEIEERVSTIIFDLMDVGLITGNQWHGPSAPDDTERKRIKRIERRATKKIMDILNAAPTAVKR